MNAAEIRAIKPGKSQADNYGGWNTNSVDGAVFCGLMLQELAAQISELNDKLGLRPVLETFRQIGDLIEKMPPEQHRRSR
jgi:hypothetical protein